MTHFFDFDIPSVMLRQQSFPISKSIKAHGGELRQKAKGRGARTLVCKSGTMHFTLRSTKAKGSWSFQHIKNRKRIESFLRSFSEKKGIKILSFANVGNHLHLHVKIHNQILYRAWIRGLTSGIAMICVGQNGFRQLNQANTFPNRTDDLKKVDINLIKNESIEKTKRLRFWDQRPFSRIIQNFRHFLNTKSYLEINQLEGLGMSRQQAELLIYGSRRFFKSTG